MTTIVRVKSITARPATLPIPTHRMSNHRIPPTLPAQAYIRSRDGLVMMKLNINDAITLAMNGREEAYFEAQAGQGMFRIVREADEDEW